MNPIEIESLAQSFTVCKVQDFNSEILAHPFCFAARTDDECSLVCRSEDVPENTTAREDGWRCFRVCGPLDFSLTGILARIADILAAEDISIFAVSTFDTDYVLTKEEQFEYAVNALAAEGYIVRKPADIAGV